MHQRTAALLLALAGLACVPRPDQAACEAMVEHVIDLTRAAHRGRAADIAGEVSEAHRNSLRDRCLDEGTQSEVDCVLATSSLDAIHGCAP